MAETQDTKRGLKAMTPSGWAVFGIRVAAGTAALIVSQTAIRSDHGKPDRALAWTVFLLGIFIISHALVELLVILLPVGATKETVPNPFNVVATVLVTTPGVVLGLLAAFGTSGTLSTVVRVAVVALASALLLGIVLNGLVSMDDISTPPRSIVIRLVFNLTLWALALGILGIALGVVYRT